MKKDATRRFSKLSLVFLLSCSASQLAAKSNDMQTAESEEPQTLYTHVNIIDGNGGPLQKNMAILISGERIAAVYSVDKIPTNNPNVNIVDSKGLYALPGLIDTHVHMATLPNDRQAKALLRRQLYSGVTSVRDMAGDGRALADLARRSRLLKIPAPDVYYSALMAGPSFFSDPRPGMSAQGETPGQVPWMQAIDDNSNIKTAVTLAKGSWATGIKIYANLPAETVKEISLEAQQQGMQVWAHSMVFPAFPHDVVNAKVNTMSHVCRLAFEISKEKPTKYHHKVIPDYPNLNPADKKIVAIFKQMAAQGTKLDATVWLYAELERMRQESDEAKKIPVKCPVTFAAQLTQAAFDAGVDISTGTDSTTPASDPYPGLHKEIETLAALTNMSNSKIIRSATLVGAKVLGLEKNIGSIEAGKQANLVFVKNNPLIDIKNLRSVTLTVKNGQQFWRKNFKALSEKELK